MKKTFLKAVVFAAAALLLTSCSSEPAKTTEVKTDDTAKKAPAGPPEPVLAKEAFYEMYTPAHKWAPDMLPLSLTSGEISGIRNSEGKAGLWTAVFGSHLSDAGAHLHVCRGRSAALHHERCESGGGGTLARSHDCGADISDERLHDRFRCRIQNGGDEGSGLAERSGQRRQAVEHGPGIGSAFSVSGLVRACSAPTNPGIRHTSARLRAASSQEVIEATSHRSRERARASAAESAHDRPRGLGGLERAYEYALVRRAVRRCGRRTA